MQRELVKFILENADKFQWSLQGLGMLRLYITPSIRLHVWNRSYAVKDVSAIHTHPWDFRSTVISGAILNIIYKETPDGPPYNRTLIKCGPGGCELAPPKQIGLMTEHIGAYTVGQSYEQRADDIHSSQPENGTVTLIEKTVPEGHSVDEAYVYWWGPKGWVSAEPRPATKEEIRDITFLALQKW